MSLWLEYRLGCEPAARAGRGLLEGIEGPLVRRSTPSEDGKALSAAAPSAPTHPAPSGKPCGSDGRRVSARDAAGPGASSCLGHPHP